MKEIVFLNGKFLDKDKAKISALSEGLLYGFGLFESMRACNQKIICLKEHLQRIKDSSKSISLKFTYNMKKLEEDIKKLVKINGIKDAYVRLTLWKTEKATEIFIFTRVYKPYSSQQYQKGFCACVSSFRQAEDSLLAKIKATSRILYQLSFREAKDNGFDEALILNNSGYLTEGTRSNLFFVKEGIISTPAFSCGCLDGITRRVIFGLAKKEDLEITEGNFTLQDLYYAQEAFLTNSLMGVMPLVSVEKHLIGGGRRGKISEFFMKKYGSLLKK